MDTKEKVGIILKRIDFAYSVVLLAEKFGTPMGRKPKKKSKPA